MLAFRPTRLLRLGIPAVLGILLAATLGWMSVSPSNDRVWIPEQAILPSAEVKGRFVHVRNIRNFSYGAPDDLLPAYYDRTFDLDRIESVWLVLSPLAKDWRGPAHAFLSFGFADSQFVAISVEARREPDEEYGILKGLLRRFEIMYVIGDERDLIQVRANHWGSEVYLYPIRASREQVRRLFVDMLTRANELRDEPEFYNTLTNNCTTNILRHVNSIAARPIPYGVPVLLPGYADELAYERGLLDTDLPLARARERFWINERSERFANRSDYSIRIREADGK